MSASAASAQKKCVSFITVRLLLLTFKQILSGKNHSFCNLVVFFNYCKCNNQCNKNIFSSELSVTTRNSSIHLEV